MRSIAEMQGLRFPDVYVVRMFFKEGVLAGSRRRKVM